MLNYATTTVSIILLDFIVPCLAIGKLDALGQFLVAVALLNLVHDLVGLAKFHLTPIIHDALKGFFNVVLIGVATKTATLQSGVGEVLGTTEEVANVIDKFLPVMIGIVVGISQQFVCLVLPIHNVNAGVCVVSGGHHDCDGGEVVLVVVKVCGGITAVITERFGVGRYIVPVKVLVTDKDTSAVIRKIRGTHN